MKGESIRVRVFAGFSVAVIYSLSAVFALVLKEATDPKTQSWKIEVVYAGENIDGYDRRKY